MSLFLLYALSSSLPVIQGQEVCGAEQGFTGESKGATHKHTICMPVSHRRYKRGTQSRDVCLCVCGRERKTARQSGADSSSSGSLGQSEVRLVWRSKNSVS